MSSGEDFQKELNSLILKTGEFVTDLAPAVISLSGSIIAIFVIIIIILIINVGAIHVLYSNVKDKSSTFETAFLSGYIIYAILVASIFITLIVASVYFYNKLKHHGYKLKVIIEETQDLSRAGGEMYVRSHSAVESYYRKYPELDPNNQKEEESSPYRGHGDRESYNDRRKAEEEEYKRKVRFGEQYGMHMDDSPYEHGTPAKTVFYNR